MQQDERFRALLLKALNMADLGIVDVRGKVVQMGPRGAGQDAPGDPGADARIVKGKIEQWRRLEIKTVIRPWMRAGR